MKFTNRLGLPEPIFRALSTDTYQKRGKYSVTELLKPVQLWWLSNKHDDDIEHDVVDYLWNMYGKLTHKIIDDEGDMNSEVPFYIELGQGVSVSGTADRVDFVHGEPDNTLAIYDYKVTSAWSLVFSPGGRKEWIEQLNTYGLLAENHYQMEVSRIGVVVILRDWSKLEATRNASYPQAPIVQIDLPLWTPEQRGEFLNDRVDAFEAASQLEEPEDLPECSEEDRWAQPTTWALMKEGRKSAVKVFKTHPELLQYLSNQALWVNEGALNESNLPATKPPLYVQVRPGKNSRCEGYCDAAPWCPQLQRLREIERAQA